MIQNKRAAESHQIGIILIFIVLCKIQLNKPFRIPLPSKEKKAGSTPRGDKMRS